jgi:molybdopterin-containing oxidoreductase family membrane subunit
MKRENTLFLAWVGALGAAILAGLITTFQLFTKGHVLFNTNDVIIWSLPLGVYIFLALASSGLTLLSAIPLIFGVAKYQPLAKRMVFLAIATLCGAFVSIGLELGTVWNMIYILFSPNLSSPIWWMGAIYSLELVLLAIKFWRISVGDWGSTLSKSVGALSVFCALVAPLMIGSVFGITESRVTYFGPVMSIYCLLMAVLSGVALFVLYSMVLQKATGEPMTTARTVVFDELASILKYVAGAVLVFTLVKLAIESATRVPEFLMIRKYEHTFGTILGLQVEVVLGLVLPFVLLLFKSVRSSGAGKVVTAALLWVGTLGMHMEILISGQSHPIGPKAEQFGEALRYFPSAWEWLVFLFAMAVMLLLYTIGERYLKLEEVTEWKTRNVAGKGIPYRQLRVEE